MTPHKKKILVLKKLLTGAKFYNAMLALNRARKYHKGLRKDGVTPEFDHQVSIALHAMTLPDLMHREETITAILLHDVPEDYHVSVSELGLMFPDPTFRALTCSGIENVTKTFRGVVKDKRILYAAMAADPVASITKGVDRIHNLQSCIGVFTYAKQVEYIKEVEEDILPMIKLAEDNFPWQAMAYQNIKHMLVSQIEMLRAIHKAAGHS